MQTRANDRLPLSRRVVLNQRSSNDIQKLSTFTRFNEFQRPHDSRENDFLDENRQFSTRNSFIDESGIRVGIVTQKDRLVGDFRTRHRPRTQIIFNPWNMAPRYPSRQSFSMNYVTQQRQCAKAVDSKMKVKDWNSLIVDPENSNTFDWEDESELGTGRVVSVKSFMKTQSSDEGSLPQRNIFPHETFRPLTFSQLMTLERNILLADYEIDSVRFPPIRVAPVDIISRLKRKISTLVEGARVESIRIMGGVASHIISPSFPFNDLDILFNLTFDFEERHRIFKQIRNQVCLVLLDILVQECPKELEKVLRRDNLSHEHASTHFPTAYFQKYIVVPPAHDKTATEDDDCWSLICLRNLLGQNLEFKFVRCCEGVSLKRHFEFSSDSFQIVIDDAYLNHMETIVKRSKRLFTAKTIGESADLSANDDTSDEIDEEFRLDAQLSYKWLPHNKDILFPHVYVVCMYPDFDEALSHLQKRHVKIYRPEELRGGGLLKYAYLRQNDFRDDPNESSESLRLAINAMVCRFLITLPDSQAQWHTIFKYLETHYPRQYPRNLDKRVNYLMILLNILAQSNAYAIEQAKSLYGVIKAMIDWIRNEMKELENQQKGEPSDFRGWNRKFTPTATPVSTQAIPPPKLNQHIIPTNPVFAYRPMSHLGAANMQNRTAHVFNKPTRQVKKQPHPVEYRPYTNKGFMEPVRVYSEEQVIADRYSFSHAETRLQPISSTQSFNESLRTHPQQNGVLLTHQSMNNHVKPNFRSASAGASNNTATNLQWDAWCNT